MESRGSGAAPAARDTGVAVVIPVWRDSERLPPLLKRLASMPGLTEVAVACTRIEADAVRGAIGRAPNVRIATARRGRAVQMNAGARITTAEWLLFLHADSTPHPAALDDILAITDPNVAGGSFRLALDAAGWQPRLIEAVVRARVRLFDLPYGDQGLFVHRRAFDALAGFADLPLMEDVDFVRRLRRLGRLRHLPRPMLTSARRWERNGWTRRTLANWRLMTQYLLGASPAALARRYTGRHDAAVAVFARTPAAGGKTRLWQSLGIEPDVRLLQAMLDDTVDLVNAVPGVDRVLAIAPSGGGLLPSVPEGWDALLQNGDDLGARMASAFEELLGMGYASVVLVGSDVPTLPPSVIEEAAALLADGSADVVIGPSDDGGYYLIGARAMHPELFAGMPWSTPDVCAETVRRAERLGLRTAAVERWSDIDDSDGLRRAAGADSPSGARTRAWIARLPPR